MAYTRSLFQPPIIVRSALQTDMIF